MDNDVPFYSIPEGSTASYEADIADDGILISGNDLVTLVLTVRQDYTREIIFSRDEADVLNTNGVTVDALGHLTWSIRPEESALLNRALPSEPHRCLFEWTHTAGLAMQHGSHEFILWVVRNAASGP